MSLCALAVESLVGGGGDNVVGGTHGFVFVYIIHSLCGILPSVSRAQILIIRLLSAATAVVGVDWRFLCAHECVQ